MQKHEVGCLHSRSNAPLHEVDLGNATTQPARTTVTFNAFQVSYVLSAITDNAPFRLQPRVPQVSDMVMAWTPRRTFSA